MCFDMEYFNDKTIDTVDVTKNSTQEKTVQSRKTLLTIKFLVCDSSLSV